MSAEKSPVTGEASSAALIIALTVGIIQVIPIVENMFTERQAPTVLLLSGTL